MIKDLIKEEVLIEGTARPFLSDSSYLRGVSSLPLVIFCHGYKGFKDWGLGIKPWIILQRQDVMQLSLIFL